jgi:ADP-ribose pyrophosphatase YjhB (NUDIX family)
MDITYPHPSNHFTTDDFEFPVIENRESYTIRPSIYVLLSDGAGNIATIGYRTGIQGTYLLPGGGVDTGETWKEGLKREVKEEIGCVISNVDSIGSFDSYNDSDSQWFKSIICTANLDGEPGNPESTENYELGSKLSWITIKEVIRKLKEFTGPKEDLIDCRAMMTLKILNDSISNL